MNESKIHTDRELKRGRLFGVLFVIIGLCFMIHGGFNLSEIYSRPATMFEMHARFTPEKGRMWSELLAGMSVCLVGILMIIKAAMDLNSKKKSEAPATEIR